jgi:hypothetical protein
MREQNVEGTIWESSRCTSGLYRVGERLRDVPAPEDTSHFYEADLLDRRESSVRRRENDDLVAPSRQRAGGINRDSGGATDDIG